MGFYLVCVCVCEKHYVSLEIIFLSSPSLNFNVLAIINEYTSNKLLKGITGSWRRQLRPKIIRIMQ